MNIAKLLINKFKKPQIKLSQEQLADGIYQNTGSLIQYDGDQLEQGDIVYLLDAAGNPSILPDGEYPRKNGGTFIITDGTVSSVSDQPAKPTSTEPIQQAQSEKEPYGNVEYADPGYQKDKQKRYPLDTEEHIRTAWDYINKAEDSSQYSPEDLKKVRDSILAAWKNKIDPQGPPSVETKKTNMSDTQIPVVEEQKQAAADTNTVAQPSLADVLAAINALGKQLTDCLSQSVDMSKEKQAASEAKAAETEKKLSAIETKLSETEKKVDKIGDQPAGQQAEKEVNSFAGIPKIPALKGAEKYFV